MNQPAIFAPILIASIALFCYSSYRRLSLVAIGAAEERADNPGARLRATLTYAFGQKRVVARPSVSTTPSSSGRFSFYSSPTAEFLVRGSSPP